ncbi:MAG: NADPH:quinone reductase [Roseiflexaceae bacterium]
MRAAWYERKGTAHEVLQIGPMALPELGPGDVRVHIAVSGINPSDTKGRGGAGIGPKTMQFPRVIPHQDGAGVIDAVGAGVPESRVGERVWLYEAQRGRASGTAAEYVVVPSDNAVRLPAGVSLVDAACLGVPAMTAHRCLFADGPIAGTTIVVTGAAGGVGQYAVQLAKWGGATVIATVSSAEKAAQARSIGADHVINYREEDVAARVQAITDGAGVDRIVEVAFGANLPASLQILKTNGVIAAYSSDADPQPTIPFGQFLGKDITVRFVLVYVMGMAAHQAAIKDITTALSAGLLHPVAVQRFALDEIAAAHEAVETGHTAGKVLIDLGNDAT